MNRGVVCAGLLGALVFVGGQARADQKQGFYVGAFGNYTFHRDSDVEGTPSGQLEFDNGWTFGGSAGYKFNYAWRAEVEGSYRKNKGDEFDTAAPGVSGNGKLTSLAIMGNVYYDILISRFIPYLGAGAGAARVKADFNDIGNDKTWEFAWQLMAGVSYVVVDNLRLRVGYRFFTTRDADFGAFEIENTSHNVEAGLLYTF